MCKEDASESVAGKPAGVLRLGPGKTLDALHSLRIHREDCGALPVAETEVAAEPSGTLVEEKKGRFLFRQVTQPLPAVRFQGILAPEEHPALHGRNIVERRVEIHLRRVGQAAKPVPVHLDRLQRTLAEIGYEIPLPQAAARRQSAKKCYICIAERIMFRMERPPVRCPTQNNTR